MPRFALLEHTGHPDDDAGRHYDLLLETGPACRTWRLVELPRPGAGPVAALEVAPHRPAWLETVAADVSAGRGHVRRVDAGSYETVAGDATDLATATCLVVTLAGERFAGRLRLEARDAGWSAILS